MSREILFKGKTESGEWVEGSLIELDRDSAYVYICKPYLLASSLSPFELIKFNSKLVLPETICQFTGLHDKHGKRIWEGDIHERENHFFVVKYGKYRDCETKEDGYGWYFEYTHRKGCESFDGTENEYVNIIGNIHDHPELLSER